jgi:hypothetical protein
VLPRLMILQSRHGKGLAFYEVREGWGSTKQQIWELYWDMG